jgi:hypothetical protein
VAEIGSVAWLERTRGRLSRREQIELMALGVRSQAVLLARRLSRSGERVGRFDPRDVRIPDSAPAREAEEVCGGLPPSVASHSHRCYLWGAILAAQDGITFDEELLYVAALLHDAGMPVAAAEGHDCCFTLDSVLAVRALHAPLEPQPRRRAAEEAIALHLNPLVARDRGAEAHLMNAAAALDVLGMRLWEIEPAAKAAVLERHPRNEFKAEWDGLCRAHIRAMPRGRVAWLYRYAGFGLQLRRAPFDS